MERATIFLWKFSLLHKNKECWTRASALLLPPLGDRHITVMMHWSEKRYIRETLSNLCFGRMVTRSLSTSNQYLLSRKCLHPSWGRNRSYQETQPQLAFRVVGVQSRWNGQGYLEDKGGCIPKEWPLYWRGSMAFEWLGGFIPLILFSYRNIYYRTARGRLYSPPETPPRHRGFPSTYG